MSQQSTGFGDDEPLVVGPRGAARLMSCGLTRVYDLIEKGEIDSYLDGGSRKITISSIKARNERLLAAAQASQAPGTRVERAVAARKRLRAQAAGRP
jgi:excisionase family DNA binding protein